jgi:anti-sigma regulatory factor (Ser/Thr protein kinase)
MREQQILVLIDTDVSKARRLGREMAVELGLGKIDVAEIEIVATELATNLLKHRTIDGELVFREIHRETGPGLEIISHDKGPGIRNPERVMQAGASTAGTLGIGLSGVKRLMDEFDLQSETGMGTVVTTRKWLKSDRPPRINFSLLARPYPGESVSGDAWFIKQTSVFSLFAVIDVLGHGPDAHEVAVQLQNILADVYTQPLLEIVRICHEKLHQTRGSAMALALIDFSKRHFEHISIGNVETRVYGTQEPIRTFCLNGTLGMAMESHYVTKYPFPAGGTIVMFSDGINGRFNIEPGLLEQSPQAIAAYIFDNFKRDSDDATVLVGRLADA